MLKEILLDASLILWAMDVAMIINIYFERRQRAMRAVFGELDRHYLCKYRISDMVIEDFFGRFRDYNNEGFCYTFSAVVMLSLRRFRKTRLVRGNIRNNDYGPHSWAEIRYLGKWYVIDLCLNGNTAFFLVSRRVYYKVQRPEVMVAYTHKEFWSDPAAQQLYERLKNPATSQVLVDIWGHYTPNSDSLAIVDMNTPLDDLTEAGEYYYLFPESTGFKFSRRIVNEFMARPERKQPKKRTLRRLARYYRTKRVECAGASG